MDKSWVECDMISRWKVQMAASGFQSVFQSSVNGFKEMKMDGP